MAISYPPALFYGDSWEYLDKAYGAFPVGLSPLRPSGYPLIIKALSVGGDPHLWAVITAQHLAGLAVGVLVYLGPHARPRSRAWSRESRLRW